MIYAKMKNRDFTTRITRSTRNSQGKIMGNYTSNLQFCDVERLLVLLTLTLIKKDVENIKFSSSYVIFKYMCFCEIL